MLCRLQEGVNYLLGNDSIKKECSHSKCIPLKVNWLSNCIISLTFLSLLDAVGTAGGFLVYFIFALVAVLVLFLFLPETKGVPLEDIALVLEQGWIIPCKKSCSQEENDLEVLVNDTDD